MNVKNTYRYSFNISVADPDPSRSDPQFVQKIVIRKMRIGEGLFFIEVI